MVNQRTVRSSVHGRLKNICMYVCITFISDSAIQNNIVIQCWGP